MKNNIKVKHRCQALSIVFDVLCLYNRAMKRKKGKKHKKSPFGNLQDRYKSVYFSWISVECPSTKSDVYFTNLGWRHLNNNERSKKEIEERLKLLSSARELIMQSKNPPTNHIRLYRGMWITYKKFEGTIKNTPVVAIILRMKKSKDFVFVSDFEDESGL